MKTPFKDMLERVVSNNDELSLSLGTLHLGEESDGFHYRLLILYSNHGYKEYKRCKMGWDVEPTEEMIEDLYYSIINQILWDNLEIEQALQKRFEKKKKINEKQ